MKPLILPVPTPSRYPMSSAYGWRVLHTHKQWHPGIDLATPEGTPCLAAADGVVLLTLPASHSGGFGDMITIQHNNGLYTRYAHLQAGTTMVMRGDRVHQGQAIAKTGNTGFSSGPHLHFEVRTDDYYTGQVQAGDVEPLAHLRGGYSWALLGLFEGNHGPRVRALQCALFGHQSKEVDGQWGPHTTTAVGAKRISPQVLQALKLD